jgi:hypothetical protein
MLPLRDGDKNAKLFERHVTSFLRDHKQFATEDVGDQFLNSVSSRSILSVQCRRPPPGSAASWKNQD